MVLTLGSFAIMLAGLDSGNVYGGIGSSGAMLAILAEPTLILVLVGISLLARAMLPFVVNHTLFEQSTALLESDSCIPGAGIFCIVVGGD